MYVYVQYTNIDYICEYNAYFNSLIYFERKISPKKYLSCNNLHAINKIY